MNSYLCVLLVISGLYLRISGQGSRVRCIPPLTDRYRAVNGGVISARCTAQGDPQPSIVWTDNLMTTYNGSSVSVESQNEKTTLFICTAQNNFGADRCFVGAYFLHKDRLFPSLLQFLNESHSYNLSLPEYGPIQCTFQSASVVGVVSNSEVVVSMLLAEKTIQNVDNGTFNTYLQILYELMCIVYKESGSYVDYNPFFGDNLYQSALILHEFGSKLFGENESKFQEFSLYLMSSLLFLENRFDLDYGEEDRRNLTEYLIIQGLITIPPTTTTEFPDTTVSSTTMMMMTTNATETHSTFPTSNDIIVDEIDKIRENVSNNVDYATLKFEELINNLISPLTQQLLERILDVGSSLLSRIENFPIENNIPPFVNRIFTSLEKSVSIYVEGNTCESSELNEGSINVSIACIEPADMNDVITIPADSTNFPIASIPLSLITQLTERSNIPTIPISSIMYNITLSFPNQAVSTRFVTLNFHLPSLPAFEDTINISFQNPSNDNINTQEAQCVFINPQDGSFNTTGVSLISIDEDTIACGTSHITSFAAIASFNRIPADRTEYFALKIISFILLAFSFFALVMSLILFCLAGKPFFESLPNAVYFNYAIALTLGCSSFLFLLSTAVLNEYYCVVAVFITQYSWISVFCWSLSICVTMVLFLKEDAIHGQVKIFSVYFILSWGVPIIPCIITLLITIPNITEDYVLHFSHTFDNATCYLSNSHPIYATWGLIGPVIFLLFLNLIGLTFFSVKFCWLTRSRSQPTFQQFRRRYVTLYIQFLILISILGLPWLFLIVNITLNYFSKNDTVTSVMEWVFLILNAPIGVVYFFAYTVKNKQVRSLLTKNIFTHTTMVATGSSAATSHIRITPSLPTSLPKARKRISSSSSTQGAILLSPSSAIPNPVFAEQDVLI